MSAPKPVGFAALTPERRREIASQGGRATAEAGTGHRFTSEEAREAGSKGGEKVSQDRQHMADIGRKAGQRVSQDREHMRAIGRKGGLALSEDREHMAEIGRRGGEATALGANDGVGWTPDMYKPNA